MNHKKKLRLIIGGVIFICMVLFIAVSRPLNKTRILIWLYEIDFENQAFNILNGEKPQKIHGVIADEQVYASEDNKIVQFEIDSFGLVSAGDYEGFYYSENGEPATFQNQSFKLIQTKENQWKWSDIEDGVNGITIHIKGHFYYYKAYF